MRKRFTFLIAAMMLLTMMAVHPLTMRGQAKPDPTYEWVLVEDYSSLSTSDTYVIAGNIKGGGTWYSLKNNQVTTNTNLPVGSTLTISNKKITSTVSDNETWVIETTGTADQYYLKSTKGSYYLQNDGNTGSKITSKSSTDGQNKWKIHYYDSYTTNQNKTYTATGLYNVGVSRELACYSSSNWRCYTGTNYSNIDGAEVVLYKRQEVSSDPTVTASPSSLSGFSYIQGHGPSIQDKHITVSGTNLSNNLVVSASSNYEVCKTQVGTYASSVEYEPSTGTVSNQTVYVRLKENLPGGSYNSADDKLTVSSTGATSVNVSLSGSVTPTYTLTISATNGHIEDGDGNTLTTGSVAQGAEIEITAVPNTGYKFASWTVSGTGSSVEDDDEITTTFTMGTEAATLTANFEARTPATVTLHDGLNGATTTSVYTYTDATLADVIEGHTIATVNGWTALGWVKNYTSGTPTLITNSEAVGSTTDLYAVYRHGNDVIYQLTTSTSDLSVGTRYMMGYYNNDYLLMTTNFAGTSAVSLDANNQYTYTTGTQWTLGGSNNAWTFTDANGKLLSSQSTTGSSASLKLETTATDYSYWSISYDDASPKHSKIQNNGNVSNNSKNLKISYYNSVFNCFDNAVVYLFKEVTEYSTAPTAELCYVTYDANGATGGDVPTDGFGYNPGTSVTVLGNTGSLEKTGYAWSGWCLNDAGTGTVYGPSYTTTYTITANTTMFAKWDVQSYSYTLTTDEHCAAELRVGGASYSAATIPFGTEVEVYVVPDDGYGYTISVTAAGENDVTVTNDTFIMPASAVTITVTSRLIMKYVLVTSDEQLVAGKHYVIASGTSGNSVEGVGYQKQNNRDAVDVEFDNGKLVENDLLWDFVLGGDATNGWTFYDKYTESEGFLRAPTSNNNYLTLNATPATYARWNISIGTSATNYKASINAKSGNRTNMRYNSSSSLFACYANSTDQSDIYLFVKEDDVDYEIYSASPITGTHSIETLYVKGKLTIKNNAVITVSGEVTNSTAKADSLIIEDGGQLKFTSTGAKDGVQATVQKEIAAWTTNPVGNWYFIASPLVDNTDPDDVNNMITPKNGDDYTFDLYRYNDAAANNLAWENYNNTTHTSGFKLVNGQGYLYANVATKTLEFTGEIKPYTTAGEANKITIGSGFNLIGNPYTFATYINKPYYKLNAEGNTILASEVKNVAINPCTGVIVNGGVSGYDIFFTETSQEIEAVNPGNIQMALAQTVATRGSENTETIDNAIVSFNEGSELPKFYFGTQNANIYIPMDNEEYAIVSSNAQGEMPVNFRAYVAGEYTITVNPEEVEMGYLHLIDNIAGKDVDLLATPSYTFNARTDDYESRFRLVFSTTMVNAEMGEDFAFISDGQLVIANEGEAILQVIDVTGRVVANENINGTCSKAISAKAGVYVLRLINGTDVKTQKIVIR